ETGRCDGSRYQGAWCAASAGDPDLGTGCEMSGALNLIPSDRLAGKVAVVTAAGQGIGRAVAERLAAEGAQVFASDMNEAALASFTAGQRAKLDATDAAAIAAYFAGFERIDILVHAVGYVHQGSI